MILQSDLSSQATCTEIHCYSLHFQPSVQGFIHGSLCQAGRSSSSHPCVRAGYRQDEPFRDFSISWGGCSDGVLSPHPLCPLRGARNWACALGDMQGGRRMGDGSLAHKQGDVTPEVCTLAIIKPVSHPPTILSS